MPRKPVEYIKPRSVVITFNVRKDYEYFMAAMNDNPTFKGKVTVSNVIESHVIPADPSGLEAGKGQRTGKKA